MPSDLPIVTPDPPPRHRTQAERYGGAYYLGIAGLVVLAGLIAWFATGLWRLRGVLRQTYVLHDVRRGEAERVEAARRLVADPQLDARQAWQIALGKDLPPRARYLLAEALTPEIVLDDPRGYSLAVARGRDWPAWLRLLAFRPIAYAAEDGPPIPREALAELGADRDAVLRLWVGFTLRALRQAGVEGMPAEPASLEGVAAGPEPAAPLARLLLEALSVRGPHRERILDRATAWLRAGHEESRKLWGGREMGEAGGEAGAARQLQSESAGRPAD